RGPQGAGRARLLLETVKMAHFLFIQQCWLKVTLTAEGCPPSSLCSPSWSSKTSRALSILDKPTRPIFVGLWDTSQAAGQTCHPTHLAQEDRESKRQYADVQLLT
ncbi:mCG145129, partial [Mus musculus]